MGGVGAGEGMVIGDVDIAQGIGLEWIGTWR